MRAKICLNPYKDYYYVYRYLLYSTKILKYTYIINYTSILPCLGRMLLDLNELRVILYQPEFHTVLLTEKSQRRIKSQTQQISFSVSIKLVLIIINLQTQESIFHNVDSADTMLSAQFVQSFHKSQWVRHRKRFFMSTWNLS